MSGSIDSDTITIDGYSDKQIHYHLQIMIDGNLTNAVEAQGWRNLSYNIDCITWFGHEFLDSIRNEGVWKHTLEKMKPFGSASLEVIKSVATSYISTQLGFE